MKITLKDIMESLNSDNIEDAQAALHEWFVDHGRTIQAQLSGEQPVAEADPVAPMQHYLVVIRELKDNFTDRAADMGMGPDETYKYFYEEFSKVFQASSAAEAEDMADGEMADCADGYDLVEEYGWNNGASGYTDEGAGEGLAVYYVDVAQTSESVDEGDKEEVTEAEDADEDDKEEVAEGKVPADDAAAEKNADEGSETPGEVDESIDDLIAELNEAFKGLETVSDKLQNVEGAQVGEEGKVPVNTKGTLPSHKGKDRLGGDPVEIKGKGHTGHALEKAPKVADVKVKNTVQNGKEELKKVADKGDKSALLNKRDGKENTQSPISGKGATGLKK